MGDMSDWARTQREDTSAAFPPRPLITDPTPEEQAVERFDAPLPGDEEAEDLALDIKTRDWDQRIADMGANIGAMISDAPGRTARGAEGLYGVADQAAEAALNYPPKVVADPLGEARRAGIMAARAQEGLVNLGKTAATGDPAAIRDAADLASMAPGTGPIPDLVSGLASYANAFDSEDPAGDVLWGTLSLATLPLWWLSTDALRKAAQSGIKQSEAAQSLQVNIHNLDLNMTDQLKKVDVDLAKGTLTPEKADLYRTQIETEGKRLVGVAETQYTAKAARDYNMVNRPLRTLKPQRGPSLLETLMPPGSTATFRAYPDTEAAKDARSIAEGINRRLNAPVWTGRRITPDQAREELEQLRYLARDAEIQAGDVVGQAQDSAIEATKSRKRGKIEPGPQDHTSAQRVVEEEANKATSVAQGREYEKDLISGTGKNRVVRKLRDGARLNVEAKKKAWREAGKKGPEPTLGPDDYYRKGTTPKPYQEGAGSQRMAPESTEFEPLYLKRIREREELLRAKKKAEANAYDPIEAELQRLGRRPGDKAAKSARYQAERRAMRRDGQWNDAELAVIDAHPDQLIEERLLKLRQEGKRVVQKEDGTFVISSERSLLGGEDMPDVDSDFLKSGKESDARTGRQRGPVGPARNVKLSPEELNTLRREQIRQAKPLISGSATPADRLRDLNTQIRDIEAKLDAAKTLERRFPGVDDGTLQRELRYDLAQALDGRDQLLREGRKPQSGRFAELDELEAEADSLLAPDVTAAKRKVAAPERQVAAENRPVEPPLPTDPRAINRTRRERLAEASEARADVEKPKTVDSLPRLGKARAGKPGAAKPSGGGGGADVAKAEIMPYKRPPIEPEVSMSPEEYRKLTAYRAWVEDRMKGPPPSTINPATGLDPSKGNIPEMAARSKRERIADALGHAPISEYHYNQRMDVLNTKAEKTWDPGELKKIDDEKERLSLDYERSIGYERPVEKVPDSELNFVGPEPQKEVDEFQAAADGSKVYGDKLSSIDPSKLPDVKGSSLDTDKFMSQVSSDPPPGHEMTSNEFISASRYKENLLTHIDTISNRPDSFFLAEGISREDYLRSVMDTHSDIVSKYGGDLSGLNRELSKNSSRSAVTGPAQQFREALGKRADVAKAAATGKK